MLLDRPTPYSTMAMNTWATREDSSSPHSLIGEEVLNKYFAGAGRAGAGLGARVMAGLGLG